MKWEYHCLQDRMDDSPTELLEKFNALGSESWEFIFRGGGAFWFKRPIATGKLSEEQIAEFEAMPFPLDQYGRPTSKAMAAVDENGTVTGITIRSPSRNIWP